MRVVIGGERVEVHDDLARALLAGLRGERVVEPPRADAVPELTELVAEVSGLVQHLTVTKELAVARADASGAYTNRRALGLAAAMSPSQLGRVLEGHGLPRDRRTGGVDLVVAFRTTDDGDLHLATEDQVADLSSFTLPFQPAETGAVRSAYADRELTYYYRPDVPLAAARLGRAAGYTLRDADKGLVACMTENVFDALFGDPRVLAHRPSGR